MKLLASAYRDEIKAGLGRANGNFLCSGGYEFEGDMKLFCGGVIYGHDFNKLDKQTKGRVFLEVPRGVLGHFVNIEDAKIKNFSVIAPTTWNATPKNIDGKRGAYEEALVGIKVKDTA